MQPRNVIFHEVWWTWHLYLFSCDLSAFPSCCTILWVNLNEMNRQPVWERCNPVNTGKPLSVGRHLYLQRGWQRYDERRRGLFYLWVVVWSVAFILVQEGRFPLSLSLSLAVSVILSWLLWRRLPQRFASADSAAACLLMWKPNTATRVTSHVASAVPAH